ncbi:hypothetical protein [Emticicia sp. C21]|uniref:hypothetical protein n=1 Tax=Emticicia sp. C21 TaxID=2302915 RepID=UPI000E34EDA4|nr:hypothetical protein [Emticicia sp. C21]RFS13915.1 hypothetical protein D0T08_24595 [Emticicia sp. C21]
MNLLLKITSLAFVVTQTFAQTASLNMQSKKWILLTNRIEKSDIHLASYSPSKLKADTFVMRFGAGGKIEYDYETNPNASSGGRIEFLDIDTKNSSWQYSPDANVMTLTLKGGYKSLDDFNFKRAYIIEPTAGGYVLKRISEQTAENLKVQANQTETLKVLVKESNAKPVEIIRPVLITEVKEEVKPAMTEAKEISKEEIEAAKFAETIAKTKVLLSDTKRWILLTNKIMKNTIKFTSYDKSKFRINTLILTFANNGKLEYDYQMDPTLEFCAGIDFLDIDTDESAWSFDEAGNVLTLTIKGGYASLDDFKFKREYKVEQTDDEYVLHKIKEHYYIDLKKQNQKKKSE